MTRPKILVVEDDEASRRGLVLFLDSEGYEVIEAPDGEEASKMLLRLPFDLVVSDDQMPNKDGMALLQEVKKRDPKCPFILMTAYATMKIGSDAMRLGADAFIAKPAQINELGEKVRSLIGPAGSQQKTLSDRTGSEMLMGSLLSIILSMVQDAVRVDTGDIWVADPPGEKLLQRASTGKMPDGGPLKAIPIRTDEGLVARAFRSGESEQQTLELVLAFGKDKPFGVLHLTREPKRPPFVEADFKAAERSAANAAIAVQHARAHEELSRTKDDMESILACMSDALFVTDSRGMIKMVNPAATEILGFAERELLGQPLRVVIDPQQLRGEWSQRLLKGETLRNHDLRLVNRRKQPVQVQINASAIRDRSGRLQSIVIVARDQKPAG